MYKASISLSTEWFEGMWIFVYNLEWYIGGKGEEKWNWNTLHEDERQIKMEIIVDEGEWVKADRTAEKKDRGKNLKTEQRQECFHVHLTMGVFLLSTPLKKYFKTDQLLCPSFQWRKLLLSVSLTIHENLHYTSRKKSVKETCHGFATWM